MSFQLSHSEIFCIQCALADRAKTSREEARECVRLGYKAGYDWDADADRCERLYQRLLGATTATINSVLDEVAA